ncbi:MAG: hypothetical protein P8Y53_05990 [Pseudolabrys sp.]
MLATVTAGAVPSGPGVQFDPTSGVIVTPSMTPALQRRIEIAHGLLVEIDNAARP